MPIHHINILYIDDDADDILLLKSLLQKLSSASKYTVIGALSYDEAQEKMQQEKVHIFLVDYKLTTLTGLEVLEKLKSNYKYTPVILLTGMEDADLDSKALIGGAADFLVKGSFSAKELERSIRYAIRNAILMQEIEVTSSRFKNIFEHSADAIVLINRKIEIVSANNSFNKLLGYNTQEKNILFTSCIVQESDKIFFEDALKNGIELIDFETVLSDGNNKKINVLINLMLHSIESDLHQVMIKNYTEIKERELELHSQRQFNATARMSRILAHEIKNPLTNIGLSVDQLNYELPQNIKDDCGDLLQIIDRNAKRINELITQLLNATRFADITKTSYSITNLISEVVEQAADIVKLKNIQLNTKLADDSFIDIDVEKIKIVLFNLIVNATDAVENYTGSILINSYKDKEKHYIDVIDNGVGLSKEQKEKIFEPFFTTKKNGTGLGLTNAQNIMLNHQGTLKVESEDNKGCKFTLIFSNEAV